MTFLSKKIASSHVLISRTDNIGDLVLTLPMVARIKQLQPGVKISVLCRAYAAHVARSCSDIDEVVELESVESRLGPWLRESDIDTVILAQPHRALAIAAFKAGIRHRIGNARQKVYQLLYCNRRVRFSKGLSEHHEAQINFEFLRPYGHEHVPTGAEIADLYHFNITHDPAITQMMQRHRFNLILHPKSNGHGREWPIEHYLTLARLLAPNEGVCLWLTGTEAEGQWVAEHAPDLLAQANVSSLFGRIDLKALLPLISQADGLIASGTGPLHISAAIGQRTLGLFPPTRPMHPGRWAALGKRAENLCIAQPICVDCNKVEGPTCDCMRAITPQQVLETVLRWVRDKGSAFGVAA